MLTHDHVDNSFRSPPIAGDVRIQQPKGVNRSRNQMTGARLWAKDYVNVRRSLCSYVTWSGQT